MFIKKDSYHDRFIIIDRKQRFIVGLHSKIWERSVFAINLIESKLEREKLINEVINNCGIDN